jgi:hypothetical protein
MVLERQFEFDERLWAFEHWSDGVVTAEQLAGFGAKSSNRTILFPKELFTSSEKH